MPDTGSNFSTLVETIYKLPLDVRQEIKALLEHNIVDSRREEIALNFKKAHAEHKSGKLKFSSSVEELKRML